MREGNSRFIHLIYRVTSCLLLCLCVLFGFQTLFGTGQVLTSKVILTVFIISILGMLQAGGTRLRSVCIIVLVVGAGMLVFSFGLKNAADFISGYFGWLMHTSWKDEWIVGYELIQVGVVTIGCYMLQIAVDRCFPLQIGLAIGFICNLLYGLFMQHAMQQLAVALMTGYILITIAEVIEKYWKKEKSQDSRQYMVWLFPFFVLYIFLLSVTPVSDSPYDWKLARNLYAGVKERFTIFYENITREGEEDFGGMVSGFSENARLVSSVIPDHRELMTIGANQSMKTNVYLAGKIYDTFLGQEWIQQKQTAKQYQMMDAAETLYAVTAIHKEESDYIKSAKLDIRYEHFRTGFVFAPLKAWTVKGISYDSTNTGLLLQDKRGYGTEYTTSFFQMNVDHPVFYDMLEQPAQEDEAIWNQVIDRVNADRQLCSFENRSAYQEVVHYVYDEDITLSEELESYIEAVTGDAKTPLQRLQKIEKELSGLTYTTNPGKLPDEVTNASEFLDYFLLDSRQGFCSYFATAFVLLARREGFPARYVEGFCVPMQGQKQVTVYSNMAHAWPEVYFEGKGWIPFEPTPGYAEYRYTPWELAVARPATENVSLGYLFEQESEPKQDKEQLEAKNNTQRSPLIIIGLSMACIIVLSFLALSLERIIRKRRQQSLSIQERFWLTLQMQFRILKKMGVQREDTQTLQDFQKNNLSLFLEMHQLSSEEFCTISIYEDFLYGNREISSEMLLQAKKEKDIFLSLLKAKNKLAYFIFSYYC